MDNKLAEIAALWAEWKFALMEQRAASFEQTALRARKPARANRTTERCHTCEHSTRRANQIGHSRI